MDIEYLLLLQNFREATNNILSPFLLWMSDFAVGFWPIAMVCMVYWAFDRKAGRRIMAGFGMGILLNGFLKLTFRILRPWIRDSRVVPYGDSTISATGYSFPSGHAAFATSLYGGLAWWQRRRNRAIAVILVIATVLVLFSRNYLGVHTLTDVVVGCVATILMMFVSCKIEDWTDRDMRRDWIVMVTGLVLCIILTVYFVCMDIQPVYDSAGTLVVNPQKIKADSFEGIGFISAFVVCRLIERRHFRFDTELKKKGRFVIGVIALIPLAWWCYHIYAFCAPYSRELGRFATHFGIVIYTMLIVPFVLSRMRLPKWMRENN